MTRNDVCRGSMLLALLLVDCYEPPYRTEVTPRAEGGVTLKRVPKDPESPDDLAAREALQSHDAGQPDRIDDLEARVKRQDEEIARLKQLLTTQPAPTSAPANP